MFGNDTAILATYQITVWPLLPIGEGNSQDFPAMPFRPRKTRLSAAGFRIVVILYFLEFRDVHVEDIDFGDEK